eukprot:6181540-Pleurochrysis_carterae.AAC.1
MPPSPYTYIDKSAGGAVPSEDHPQERSSFYKYILGAVRPQADYKRLLVTCGLASIVLCRIAICCTLHTAAC